MFIRRARSDPGSVRRARRINAYSLEDLESTALGRFMMTSHGAEIESDFFSQIITLNCHGSYSNDFFALPEHVYILAPHPNGFEKTYLIDSPPARSFEEIIYANPGNLPLLSSNGWYLYKPGEKVRKINFSPWSNSMDTQTEYNAWVKRVPPDDIVYVQKEKKGAIPSFSIVPVRNSEGNAVFYKEKQKFKIKVFGITDLEKITQVLQEKISTKPIILIPFACNARSGDNPPRIHLTRNFCNVRAVIDKFLIR